jgi:hypothetical protein
VEVFLTNEHVCIVMEYANSGSLFHHVQKSLKLPEDEARWYFQQIVLAVDYCHRKVKAAGGGWGALPWLQPGLPGAMVPIGCAALSARRLGKERSALLGLPRADARRLLSAAGHRQPRHQAGEHAAAEGPGHGALAWQRLLLAAAAGAFAWVRLGEGEGEDLLACWLACWLALGAWLAE